MIRNLLFITFLTIAITANCQTPVPGGNVSGTWTLSGSPYLIQGSILVPNDSTLIIQPGVTVNFQGHYKFLILGRLLAIGTENNTIILTDTYTNDGWYGIRFDNTSSSNDSSIFDYCQVNGGRATDPEPWGGAFEFSNFSKVRISHCLLSHNFAQSTGGAIDCYSSSPLITNNTFEFNTADYFAFHLNGGGAISCFESSPIISNNLIKNNSSSDGGGGAILFQNGHPLIANNVIRNNSNSSTSNNGGGAIYANGQGTIINNIISNNQATGYTPDGGGLFFYDGDNSTLINNTITNNYAFGSAGCGGAIFCTHYSVPVFINNTITNNLAGHDGGALYCSASSTPSFRNCIIYGNIANQDTNQVFLFDEASDPDFSYCDVQRGLAGFSLNGNFFTGNYQNNINRNPLFNSPSHGSGPGYDGVSADWSESGLSPCINAGDTSGIFTDKDLAGNPRIVENRIDMGAYEDQFLVGTNGKAPMYYVVVRPNPFSNFTVINFNEIISGGTLRIFDASGRSLKIITGIFGDHLRIDRENLPAGVYYYEIWIDKLYGAGTLMVIDP